MTSASNNAAARRFGPFSQRQLEQYLLDEVAPELACAIDDAARVDAALAQHLQERRAEQAAFRLQHPRLRKVAPSKEARLPRKLSLRWFGGLATAGALAAALFSVIPTGVRFDNEGVRSKGSATVQLIVQRQSRTFAYDPGVLLRPGDALRLQIDSPSGGFVTLLGRDRSGVTSYYSNVEISSGRQLLDDSLVLDDSAGAEQWFLCVTAQPLAPDKAEQQLRQGEKPEGLIATIPIHKERLP